MDSTSGSLVDYYKSMHRDLILLGGILGYELDPVGICYAYESMGGLGNLFGESGIEKFNNRVFFILQLSHNLKKSGSFRDHLKGILDANAVALLNKVQVDIDYSKDLTIDGLMKGVSAYLNLLKKDNKDEKKRLDILEGLEKFVKSKLPPGDDKKKAEYYTMMRSFFDGLELSFQPINKFPHITGEHDSERQDSELISSLHLLTSEGFDNILSSEVEPTVESLSLAPDTLITQEKDNQLIVYWLEDGKKMQKSFALQDVASITEMMKRKNVLDQEYAEKIKAIKDSDKLEPEKQSAIIALKQERDERVIAKRDLIKAIVNKYGCVEHYGNKVVVKAISCAGLYTVKELETYFNLFNDTMKNSQYAVTIRLGDARHGISVGFNPAHNPPWVFIDANNNKKLSFCSAKEAAENVMTGFLQIAGQKLTSTSTVAIVSHFTCFEKNSDDLNSKAKMLMNVDAWKEIHSSDKFNKLDSTGASLLEVACKNNVPSEVTRILQTDPKLKDTLNTRLSSGDTLLIRAVKQGYIEIAKILLDNLADPNRTNKNNATPLAYAVSKNKIEMVKLLFDRRANPNQLLDVTGPTEEHTLLTYAIKMGHWEMAKVLIENKADCYAKGKQGTPLDYLKKFQSASPQKCKEIEALINQQPKPAGLLDSFLSIFSASSKASSSATTANQLTQQQSQPGPIIDSKKANPSTKEDKPPEQQSTPVNKGLTGGGN